MAMTYGEAGAAVGGEDEVWSEVEAARGRGSCRHDGRAGRAHSRSRRHLVGHRPCFGRERPGYRAPEHRGYGCRPRGTAQLLRDGTGRHDSSPPPASRWPSHPRRRIQLHRFRACRRQPQRQFPGLCRRRRRHQRHKTGGESAPAIPTLPPFRRAAAISAPPKCSAPGGRVTRPTSIPPGLARSEARETRSLLKQRTASRQSSGRREDRIARRTTVKPATQATQAAQDGREDLSLVVEALDRVTQSLVSATERLSEVAGRFSTQAAGSTVPSINIWEDDPFSEAVANATPSPGATLAVSGSTVSGSIGANPRLRTEIVEAKPAIGRYQPGTAEFRYWLVAEVVGARNRVLGSAPSEWDHLVDGQPDARQIRGGRHRPQRPLYAGQRAPFLSADRPWPGSLLRRESRRGLPPNWGTPSWMRSSHNCSWRAPRPPPSTNPLAI